VRGEAGLNAARRPAPGSAWRSRNRWSSCTAAGSRWTRRSASLHFSFRLPLAPVPADGAGTGQGGGELMARGAGGRRLGDDPAADADAARAPGRHEVADPRPDGQEGDRAGQRCPRRTRPDVLLLDAMMPRKSRDRRAPRAARRRHRHPGAGSSAPHQNSTDADAPTDPRDRRLRPPSRSTSTACLGEIDAAAGSPEAAGRPARSPRGA